MRARICACEVILEVIAPSLLVHFRWPSLPQLLHEIPKLILHLLTRPILMVVDDEGHGANRHPYIQSESCKGRLSALIRLVIDCAYRPQKTFQIVILQNHNHNLSVCYPTLSFVSATIIRTFIFDCEDFVAFFRKKFYSLDN